MRAVRGSGIATRLAALIPGGVPPVRLRAWDGSVSGPRDGPEIVVRDPAALRRLLWSPNELGLAQAYIAGEIDVEVDVGGDLAEAMRQVWRDARTRSPARGGVQAERLRVLRIVVRWGVPGPRPRAPDVRAHDLPNEFYALILDRRMAYSCGYWTSDDPGYGLEQAQFDKLEMTCRKLGLEPGMRMLDVGCGWGALAVHAARHHRVTVTGVTRSERQRTYALARLSVLDLAGAVEIRRQDYREVDDGPYDAISAIEVGEYVGADRYPAFAARLYRLLAPRARLVVQQMSGSPPGGGASVESYLAPGRHPRPVGETVALLERAGLEVRDVHVLREHYARTLRAWSDALEARWDEAVVLVGEPVARVWRLHLAGGTVAFEQGRAGVHQILAVRPAAGGASGMPDLRA
jgi:cyclopropane-fatty-acyl-phospholipid synthase